MKSHKLYAGGMLKELRSKLGLTQLDFSGKLDVSVSYLNQMENNNRPVAANVILTLARDFGVNVAEFGGGDTTRLIADLQEALADPIFKTTPSIADLQLIAGNAPALARSMLDLYRGYRNQNERFLSFDSTLGGATFDTDPQPWEEVRDFFHYCDNYIDAIDRFAERLSGKLFKDGQNVSQQISDYLAELGVSVKIVKSDAIRRYDPQSGTLYLAQHLEAETKLFQMAYHLAMIECQPAIEATLDLANLSGETARHICQIGLANYFAGALLMPYDRFKDASLELRHDLQALAQKFSCSVEQVAHRLSTLQRSGNQGIPFFFVRVDQAGTITKRHSATKLQFARFGGACPLWNVHRAFETPSQFLRQLAETPDGARYLCLARDVSKSASSFRAPTRRFAIGLGCEIEHASKLVYADDLDAKNPKAFEPIGISCRICPRQDCHQRSVPPMNTALKVDPFNREIVPFQIK